MRTLLPALAVLAACTGPESEIRKLTPDIFVVTDGVDNSLLDLGEVVVLYDSEATFQVANAGRADLEISSITISGNDDGVYTLTPGEGTVEPEGTLGIGVGFAPPQYLRYDRTITINSNDPDTPALEIALKGEGVDGPVPDIALDKGAVDFGTVTVGEKEIGWFTLQNTGDGPLEVAGFEQTGSGAFSAETPLVGQVLAPGSSTQIIFAYEPTVETGDSGRLTILSNDPDEPAVEVLLVGNGGAEADYPVPEFPCPTEVEPLAIYDFDGRASFDPGGNEPLTFDWEVIQRPFGSTAELQNANTPVASQFIDMAGFWTVQLKVTNTVGLSSAPKICNFTAIPRNNLHVELTWNTGDTDLDLHLVQNGFDMWDAQADCCWCNRNPNWGSSGDADDPQLSLDNRVGFGPENINLEFPDDGGYHVYVDYFNDLAGSGASTTATVKVWLNGVEAGTYTENLRDGQVWYVGMVRWPEAVFNENLTEDPARDGKSQCE